MQKGLDSEVIKIELKDSGYRKFETAEFEILLDVGQIAPEYQPGHSHADSLQFLLNYKNEPIIVDTGISTYEKNDRRQLERSTCSHNTVTINDQSSSEVWGGFRVAKRAKVSIQKETATEITASHNGYRKLGITHIRSFSLKNNIFLVEDEMIVSRRKQNIAQGHLHFHPEVSLSLEKNILLLNGELEIEFLETEKLELKDYQFAEGYNCLVPAKKMEYSFQKKATLIIKPVMNSFSS